MCGGSGICHTTHDRRVASLRSPKRPVIHRRAGRLSHRDHSMETCVSEPSGFQAGHNSWTIHHKMVKRFVRMCVCVCDNDACLTSYYDHSINTAQSNHPQLTHTHATFISLSKGRPLQYNRDDQSRLAAFLLFVCVIIFVRPATSRPLF